MVRWRSDSHPSGDIVRRVQIQLLRTFDEFSACERLQDEVWGTLGAGRELMAVTQKYAGVVLGALVGKKVVGFLYAILARRHGRLIHWSHMMAVREGFRDLGLGFRMKLAHRNIALAEGIQSICWTYDPLQSRNATLNLTRLAAEVEEYVPNCYGPFASTIERGVPSDRFVVNWRIASAAVIRRLKDGPANLGAIADTPRANLTRVNPKGLLENVRLDVRLRAPRVLVEIPAQTDTMRSKAPELALRWRMETRRIFQHSFAVGYRVAGFVSPTAATAQKCFYVLDRKRSRRALASM